ncbi:aspartyl-phosphate phosphatase Spo0E family protein [Gracilibacillus sp. S3-1-1]|uniref:Aspartyl-phosphate phosphatase Spo0E family protein n=1 Tax=Gracilibacillus pellucidus TaxID=3095368 RepID=A0ACC6M5T5_9BACI|nr:aspartyl-phosphate phosphatase Spo0E family protein [Gracilibacillus sp. S3-1-1]MDX8046202.1 aspartyl-phosphate phosphatase Spo0E family protein [Gracilibacillus sp. S3-1-1]
MDIRKLENEIQLLQNELYRLANETNQYTLGDILKISELLDEKIVIYQKLNFPKGTKVNEYNLR